ncbi:Arc40 protein [Saccharomycopsis crataegensis]|uniref:Actin-related protein 2/3 complex subunit n=1 Tax=Saccharomycopsis crataegensis TaxID=43959 RepID=A0AAV5QJ23_9ASCO|nr:Arc40 protein [Saccharomycopsis crataegensis]
MMGSSPAVFKFKSVVNDHIFFGPDNSRLAVTQEKEIQIYEVLPNNNKKLLTVLTGHDEPITAIDISAQGLIASASQDRNAIVWKPLDASFSSFKKDLVLLRINRSATCVKWSPLGNKFAVGSGAKVISVCYHEPENDWWISKHLKKPFKSTILSVAWHPNNVLLSCGTADYKCYVLSGYVKGVDEKPPATLWGSKLPFNTICGEFISSPGGWVHDVAFSPSGDVLGFVSNDSTITIVYPKGEEQFNVVSSKTNYGSFKTLEFISDNQLITAGHNCFPVIFQGDEESWEEARSIDTTATSQKPKTFKSLEQDDDEEGNTGSNALSMFRQLDLKGKVQNKGSSDLPTVHQNTVTTLKFFDQSHISTSGVDGKVVVFPI